MAERLDPKDLITLQELAVSTADKIAALVAVLERKGMLTEQEVLDEIRRMKHPHRQGAVMRIAHPPSKASAPTRAAPREPERAPDVHPAVEGPGAKPEQTARPRHIVLVCGLNIRGQNQITLDEQREALHGVADLGEIGSVGDKGSYTVTSQQDGDRVVTLILNALKARRPDLEIAGAAVASLADVTAALAELRRVLAGQFGDRFHAQDYSITLGTSQWRAGLALPLSPASLSTPHTLFHETKNAMVFGWTPGGVLVAKREAHNVHWGTTVTDPAQGLIRIHERIEVDLTSRSANTMRDLVAMAGDPVRP